MTATADPSIMAKAIRELGKRQVDGLGEMEA
jgi:hypothetical protein